MLTSKRRGALSGLASQLPALLQIGKNGPTDALAEQLKALLDQHELVKAKFVDFKDDKVAIANDLALATKSELVRVIGNIAIFFRQNPDPEKRHPEYL
jgi:RNA-binding protein